MSQMKDVTQKGLFHPPYVKLHPGPATSFKGPLVKKKITRKFEMMTVEHQSQYGALLSVRPYVTVEAAYP